MTRIALALAALSLLACNGPPCEVGRRRCVAGATTTRTEMCLESGWVSDQDCTPPDGWIGQCVSDPVQGARCFSREIDGGV